MNQLAENALCMYRAGDTQIHEFVFANDNRDAINQWADHIERLQLAHQWYNQGEVRLFIDSRQALHFPIRYLLEVLSDYNRAYAGLEPPRVMMAIVTHPKTMILEIYQMMAGLLAPPLTMQFFSSEKEACDWLRQN